MHLNCHPEYQLQAQFASYLIMIVTIILTLETGMKGECDIEWFNVMSMVMATGFVATDLEHMYMLTYTVKTRSKLGMIKDFFSNGYYSYRLLGHSSYVGGSILKVEKMSSLKLSKLKKILMNSMSKGVRLQTPPSRFRAMSGDKLRWCPSCQDWSLPAGNINLDHHHPAPATAPPASRVVILWFLAWRLLRTQYLRFCYELQ